MWEEERCLNASRLLSCILMKISTPAGPYQIIPVGRQSHWAVWEKPVPGRFTCRGCPNHSPREWISHKLERQRFSIRARKTQVSSGFSFPYEVFFSQFRYSRISEVPSSKPSRPGNAQAIDSKGPRHNSVFSPHSLGFNPMWLHLSLVADQVTLEQFSLINCHSTIAHRSLKSAIALTRQHISSLGV
jgi:hypothetical protein